MNKDILKKEIQLLLETIIEQNTVINDYQDIIPQIELDITQDNIRKLYEAFRALDKINKRINIQEPVKEVEVIKEIVVVKEEQEKIIEKTIEQPTEKMEPVKVVEKKEPIVEKTEDKVSETPIITTVKEEKKILNIEFEKKPEVQPRHEEPKEHKSTPVVKEVKKPVSNPNLFSEQTTLADKFKDNTTSINEKISRSILRQTLESRIKKTPISDLKAAIGVNEKFRFINELFKGNLAEYTEAVIKLNAFAGIEEAASFLEALSVKYKWDTSSGAFSALSELVGRRYL
ncbi:MAG: hypothetical protein PHT69_01660 [Bacteroidales bacterium]|nr:hypothetical protein [Bacteroidales bacterium]